MGRPHLLQVREADPFSAERRSFIGSISRIYAGDKLEQHPRRTGPAIRLRSIEDPVVPAQLPASPRLAPLPAPVVARRGPWRCARDPDHRARARTSGPHFVIWLPAFRETLTAAVRGEHASTTKRCPAAGEPIAVLVVDDCQYGSLRCHGLRRH